MTAIFATIERLGPFVRVGVWLIATIAVVNLVLHILALTPALNWLPDRVTGAGFLNDSRQRVSSAVQFYETAKMDEEQYLCAVVGISDAREGVSLRRLSELVGRQYRFLGVAGAGAGIESVASYA